LPLLAFLTLPAQAQMGGGRHQGDDRKSEQNPQVDEKAYKAALERNPEPKEKYDPWARHGRRRLRRSSRNRPLPFVRKE
jgi:hypothetical protein